MVADQGVKDPDRGLLRFSDTKGLGFFAVALVLSDGLHDGDHRIIIVSNEYGGGRTVQQVEYSWSKGIPSAIGILETGDTGYRFEDFVIALETAPYAVVVQGEDDRLRPSFLAPGFEPIRLGASDVSYQIQGGFRLDYMTVLLGRSGEVAIYSVGSGGGF